MIFADDSISEIILDARCDVLSWMSNAGQTSMMSIPNTPPRVIFFKSMDAVMGFNPIGTGTETPGAKEGSMQSMSNDT